MVNTPIPHSLKSEAKKAAKILKEFTVPTAKMGPDKLIPAGIFTKAKGLAVLTVVKAGFLVTARGGSGIVIAKKDDSITSGWSAPSAIGIAGIGGGFEIGAEVTDFVIILNKRSAVEAFSKGGNLTIGGNFTVAAGPLGRNLEADVALRSTAAIYTYSKTRGIFAGISVEGSALIERKDANKKFYGRDIRAYEILQGYVDPPEECACLYEVLEGHRKQAEKELVRMAKKEALKAASGATGDLDLKSKFSSFTGSFKSRRKSKDKEDSSPGKDWDSDDSSSPPLSSKTPPLGSKTPPSGNRIFSKRMTKTTKTVTKNTSSNYKSSSPEFHRSHQKSAGKTRPRSVSGASNLSTGSNDSWDLWATAKHPFEGQLPCDLSFRIGDKIEVLTRTDTKDDWWEGRFKGNVGIFPANYVQVKY
ncbi:SH3 domain-containing YSC84-like protein 1 [Mercenaria mercenaria]|uniref:SH3 domain-containing YSC84-like protein 1 n=1 Tax=Mercenaria mercenaria TaxID=6596 RepID=UPI00234EB3E8|nr:SH3 domain-containing YSC84-like protein 1 [Mercenaria mercenaria]XP_053384522.1 SH3 domain-containing YSC84-like protein 1 [Mercenaria mercenaria]